MTTALDSSGIRLNRVGAAALVPRILRERAVDPEAVFAAADVAMEAVANPDALVPIADLARVLSVAARACVRPDFGLLIADYARAEQAGLLGEIFRSAPDLRTALNGLIRYFHLNTRGGIAVLTIERGVAELQLGLLGPYGDAAFLFEDAHLGIVFHHMRAFLGEGWRPIEVLLSHAAPERAVAYHRFFGAPLRFDAACTALLFSADDLTKPAMVRERGERLLTAAAEAASSKLEIRFSEQVRWVIRANLAVGKTTIAPVAHALGMSPRTLNRRLAENRLSFAGLLRGVRFDTARRLLVESGSPLAEIATAVGYSDASVFSTAFRSWAGVSPSEWRRLHGRPWPTGPKSKSCREGAAAAPAVSFLPRCPSAQST
ncbi:MAG: AraC family transcriptional regulator [Enhydrobacter sp.]|nr:AraC family transcriptional regulator [Enhydrobacter sp.]